MEHVIQKGVLESILLKAYGTIDIDCFDSIIEFVSQSGAMISVNAQFELQKNRDNFEARKIALDAAVKTLATTGGDLTENAIKYKRFLLNETVNEN